jgi:fatty acid desaturase
VTVHPIISTFSGHEDYDRHVHAVDLTGMNLWVEIEKRLAGWEGFKVAFQKYIPFFEEGQTGNRQQLKRTPPTIGFLLAAAFWNSLFLAACILEGRWYFYFILWAYPLFTVAQLFNMVRTCAEHQPEGFPAADLDKPPIVRTTLPSVLEKWLIYGMNFNYHLEHHLWPHVPFFNLPKLHAHLIERGFYEQRPDLLQCTAFGSFWRLHRLSLPRWERKGLTQ